MGMIDATEVASSLADCVEPGMLLLRTSASKNCRSDGYTQLPVAGSWPVSDSALDGEVCEPVEEDDADADVDAYGEGGGAWR